MTKTDQACGVSAHLNPAPGVDQIAATIDATISGILADKDRNIGEFLQHLERSPVFCRMVLSQTGSFLDATTSIPDRIFTIAAVSLWMGFEVGKADTMGRDMERLFCRELRVGGSDAE